MVLLVPTERTFSLFPSCILPSLAVDTVLVARVAVFYFPLLPQKSLIARGTTETPIFVVCETASRNSYRVSRVRNSEVRSPRSCGKSNSACNTQISEPHTEPKFRLGREAAASLVTKPAKPGLVAKRSTRPRSLPALLHLPGRENNRASPPVRNPQHDLLELWRTKGKVKVCNISK